ncbi:hypothetical protein [Mycobacterium europaeum]|nr:hypothetical protein [Mycobacterium europaeum]
MPTPLRAIRVDDELWHAALAKAEAEGRALSEVIRELLERWVKRPARQR